MCGGHLSALVPTYICTCGVRSAPTSHSNTEKASGKLRVGFYAIVYNLYASVDLRPTATPRAFSDSERLHEYPRSVEAYRCAPLMFHVVYR